MTSSEPVMNDACSDTRNATASAISFGLPIRPNGARCASRVCVAVVEHGRRDRSGEHGVHPDARRRKFRGGDLGQPPQRPFRRSVRGMVRERPHRAGTARVDDRQRRRPRADARSAARMPRNGPKQLNRQLLSKPAGVSSASGVRCRTPALLTSVVSAPNRSTICTDRRVPLLLGRHVQLDGETAPSPNGSDGGLEFVDPHVACGDAEAVVEQSLGRSPRPVRVRRR